jgi:hypothetical protein
MSEVRNLSLQEAGVEPPGSRRERRRREEGRLRTTPSRPSRDNSRDNRHTEDRERRRRPDDSEGEARPRREQSSTLRPEGDAGEDMRRQRSREGSRHRRQESSRTAARQIEHQSSLRSLISSSDVDSHEMEEEILRQIQEEGLLDGIDLENIDVSQEDQISERIAQAFRRRQREQARERDAARRADNSPVTRSTPSVPSVSSTPRETSVTQREPLHGDTLQPTTRRRNHSRSTSSNSPRSSAGNLEAHSSDEGRRRRRTTSTSRPGGPAPAAAVSIPPDATRPATRAQTDLSNRPRSSQSEATRPPVSLQSRSTTDPTTPRRVPPPLPPRTAPVEATIPATQPSIESSSRRSSGGVRVEAINIAPIELPSAEVQSPLSITRPEQVNDGPVELPLTPSRAAPPAAISVPVAVTSSSVQPQQSLGAQDNLTPAPLSPRHTSSPSERASALSSASRPTSSSSTGSRVRSPRFPEPSISCSRCSKPHIEYELHYNCYICSDGNWNICLDCFRRRAGCLYWFGFGKAAWARWDSLRASGDLKSNERPHMLTANRYIPPRIPEGGADGRRVLTTEDPQKRLQSGVFCASCLAWANECYWRCDSCNDDDWGFCNTCVNQGKCCTHSLLPLIYKPADDQALPLSPTHDQQTPSAATLLIGPGVVEYGPFKPLTFRVNCDICHYPIQPSYTRYHCFSCTSSSHPDRPPGDYDICTTCYSGLMSRKRISPENGSNGWRRCLQGHRMVIVGFDDSRGGQRRVIVQDLVGGLTLRETPSTSLDHAGLDLQQWSWADGKYMRLVTTNVAASAPTTSTGLKLTTTFPPDGGVGMKALAVWAWYPKEGEGVDELLFPRGAEVRECVDVNGDWYFGSYMGAKGLFPANHLRVV